MNRKGSQETTLEIVRRYEAGESASVIAKSLGWSHATVVSRLKLMGVTLKPVTNISRRVFTPEQDVVLARRYKAGETATSIAAEFGCDKTSVLQALRRVGVRLRNGGRPKARITAEMRGEIIAMYDAGKSRGAIARRFELHDNAVKRVLRESKREIEARRGGENHHAWKGGAYIDHFGYRRIRLDRNDPLLSMCNSNDYVMEHRWVMARSLGRQLHKGESVHHVDGNRLNNELSNLQLRQGNHGKGSRWVCLDCGSHNVKAVQLSTKES